MITFVLRVAFSVFALGALSVLSGCSTVGGSAIRTGPTSLPSYSGPVAVYASGQRPEGAVDLGVVEAHGALSEGTVDLLLPVFLQKVAQIGGNAAVIDGVRARYYIVPQAMLDSYYYRCRWNGTCATNQVVYTSTENRILFISGHAYSLSDAPKSPGGTPGPSKMEAP